MSIYVTIRNQEAIYLFNLAYLLMATLVTGAAFAGGVPMPPEAHGGAIHTIPAEVWGLVCVAICIGSIIAHYLSCFAFLAAWAAFGTIINGYLCIFATEAAFGFLVSKGALVFTLLYLGLTLGALIDAARFYLLTYGARSS